MVNTLDPDVLVMGGGMSNVDELYRDLPPKLATRNFSTVSIPRSARRVTATPAASAARRDFGPEDFMTPNPDISERFDFALALVRGPGDHALGFLTDRAALDIKSKGCRTWPARPTSRPNS